MRARWSGFVPLFWHRIRGFRFRPLLTKSFLMTGGRNRKSRHRSDPLNSCSARLEEEAAATGRVENGTMAEEKKYIKKKVRPAAPPLSRRAFPSQLAS